MPYTVRAAEEVVLNMRGLKKERWFLNLFMRFILRPYAVEVQVNER
jgi:hypothetical protein